MGIIAGMTKHRAEWVDSYSEVFAAAVYMRAGKHEQVVVISINKRVSPNYDLKNTQRLVEDIFFLQVVTYFMLRNKEQTQKELLIRGDMASD